MRFVVYGAGAVGAVIGGRLYQAGHDVTLVARGAHLEALGRHGLRLRSPDHEDQVLEIPVAPHPSEVEWRGDEVVLLTVKSQDSAAALDALAAAAPDVAVVTAQNGVENERQALRRFSAVYSMCVMLPARHLHPGVVEANSAPLTGILDVGRIPNGVDDTARRCASALSGATFDSLPDPAVMRWKYRKLLMNLANAVDALCVPSEAAGELVRRARAEGEACLAAAGIEAASEEEDKERRRDRIRPRPVGRQDGGISSSWQSLARATGSIESDYLNGEIVLLGRCHGVATPVNAVLQAQAREAASRRHTPRSRVAQHLLALADGGAEG